MDITLISRGIPDLLPMERTGDPASHVSYIIRDMCIRLGHFESDEERGGPSLTRLELGNSFEDAVVRALAERYIKSDPDRYVRLGELTMDGLIGTSDLYDAVLAAIIEIKLTWMSSRHGDDVEGAVKFWKYLTQLMAYCRMAYTRIGFLHVCFVNGDYRSNRDPDYRAWRIEFTQEELDENWIKLTRHAALMRRERAQGATT